MHITCICECICHLGECPIWDNIRKKLYWTDILQRQIWEYDPARPPARVFWRGDMMVGGFALTGSGDIVLCTDRGVFKRNTSGDLTKIYAFDFHSGERFNDITTDPAGRIFAGTLRPDRCGGILYRLEKNKPPIPVIRDIGISNGMAFSMDEKSFFHTDSYAMTIMRYQYDASSGALAHPELFFQSNRQLGLPDGITIDRDNHIWAAFWGGGCIRRINPCGKIVAEIPMPAKNVSSLIFGGQDSGDLYVTTACEGAADLQKGCDEKGVFLGGHVYHCRPGVYGRPEWPANF